MAAWLIMMILVISFFFIVFVASIITELFLHKNGKSIKKTN